VDFKNLTKYFFTCCKFKMIWQLILQSGSRCSVRFLCTHFCVAFWYPSKVNRTHIGAFSLVYTFGSDHLDTLVLSHSVIWMYETGTCTMIWNVQEASAAVTKLVLYVVTRRVAEFCTHCRQFVRVSETLYNNALTLVQLRNKKGLD